MRDQPAPVIDDICLAALADLDLRHDVPDELEVDLGDADIVARAAQRDGHVGFGVAPKTDGPVVRPVCARRGEPRILRQVGAAADAVGRKARHAQLLDPLRIELDIFGDRGRLMQQAGRIQAPIVKGRGLPRQLGGPGDLRCDVLDELVDPLCRPLRLLALKAHAEPGKIADQKTVFEKIVGQQGKTHHADKKRHVFAEQPAPGLARSDHRGRRLDPRIDDVHAIVPARGLIGSPSWPEQEATRGASP